MNWAGVKRLREGVYRENNRIPQRDARVQCAARGGVCLVPTRVVVAHGAEQALGCWPVRVAVHLDVAREIVGEPLREPWGRRW